MATSAPTDGGIMSGSLAHPSFAVGSHACRPRGWHRSQTALHDGRVMRSMVPVALAVLEKKRGALWSASGLREPVDRVANLRQHLPYPSIEGLAFADARRGRC